MKGQARRLPADPADPLARALEPARRRDTRLVAVDRGGGDRAMVGAPGDLSKRSG